MKSSTLSDAGRPTVKSRPADLQLASERLIGDVVPGSELHAELIKRFAYADSEHQEFPPRRNGVYPV